MNELTQCFRVVEWSVHTVGSLHLRFEGEKWQAARSEVFFMLLLLLLFFREPWPSYAIVGTKLFWEAS